jgi:hypothetical protein
MRKQLLALGLAAISSAAVAQPNGVPTSGLLAYYSFNSDLQSHNGWHNLTWGGTQGSYVPGRPSAGEACLLNGTHLIGSMAVPLTIPTGDFTIAGWIKLENAVPNGSYPTLMEWDESLFLRLFSQQGGTVLSQQGGYLSTGGGFAVAEGGFFVSPNTQWMHLAMTQANGTLTLYQNGVSAAQISVSGNAQSNEPVGLVVGGGSNGGAINAIKYLNGAIDDLYIYNRGLSLEEIQTVFNSTDCNLGTLALSNGSDICSDPNNPTTLFVPGSSDPYNASLFVESNGGTGIPGGSIDIGGHTFPFSLQVLYGYYPDIQGEFNVKVITPDCQSVPVTVNFLPAGDPACHTCSVGIVVSDGDAFCSHEYVNIQSWGSASTNPGGFLTFELIPLEGQTTGIDLTTTVYPVFNNINIQPSQDGLEAGQYEVQLKMYYAGQEVPCDWASVSITILPETAEGCFCEIGTLLVDNGTVICPGETVTILQAGSVQLPAGRDLYFEIYDYPDYVNYFEEQFPFEAPYTFTHDGTYFGEAVFYVGASGIGGPVAPVNQQNRGGSNDICDFYEVFVTLAQSTDAACLGVGISDLGAAAISLQPNPTSGLVQLVGTTKGDLVQVTDMTGRLIGSTTLEADNGTIDLSAMTSGIYLLRTAGGVFKVVKD